MLTLTGDLSARRPVRFLARVAPTRSKTPDDPFFGRAANTAIEVEQLQKFIQTYDYVSGDFIWTGIDYLGESRWPAKLGSSGALDTCGFPKDAYYFYQSRWTQRNRASLFPSLELGGKRGQGHYRDLLYQLRHGRTVPQWQEPGGERICFSPARHGGHVWELSGAGKGIADDGGPSSVVGCALYRGNAYCQRSKRG